MEPGRLAVDVTSRLVGIDFGSDRSRIAIAAQLRNALAKLRTRRGLLNQELTLLLAEMGEAAAQSTEEGTAAGITPDETDANNAEGPNGAIAKNADTSKAPSAAKKPDFVYSRLQQLYLKGTQRADLNELVKERAAIQEKIVQFQQRAGKRLPPQKEPPRLRTNWDCVLEEMRWMAADFMHEDTWKRTLALSVAKQTKSLLERKEKAVRMNERVVEIQRWTQARRASQMISEFWSTIRRLQSMQRNRAPLDLVVQRSDQYARGIYNDLAIDTNPINEYFRSCSMLSQKSVSGLDEEWREPYLNQLVAQRDAMVRLRFGEPIADFGDPLSNTSLHQHQRQCVAWLEAVSTLISPASFIIADDQGLGKRISVMAWMSLESAPHLVITTPLNLLRWDSELKCRYPNSNAFVYTNRESWPSELPPNSVVITSFEMPLDDVHLMSQSWKCIAIDSPEDSAIDFTSARWSSLTKLNACVRILLFRHLASLQTDLQRSQLSLLNFIAPRTFRDLSQLYESLGNQKPLRCEGILGHDFLNAFCLRRTLTDVQGQLPCLNEYVIPLSLSERQSLLYDEVAPVESLTTLPDLVRAVTRLHSICTHPDLFRPVYSRHSILFEIGPAYAQRLFVQRDPLRAVSRQLMQCFIERLLPRRLDGAKFSRSANALRCCLESALDPHHQSVTFPRWLSVALPGLIADLDSTVVDTYRDSPSIQLSRNVFVPAAIARISSLDLHSDHKDGYLDIGEPRFLVGDSGKLRALYDMLREQYRPSARIVIIACSCQTLDVIQRFLGRHRFRYIRELPIPTNPSIGRFALDYVSEQAPFIYLTSSRTMSVFSYPSLSLFSSVIVFEHDWNPTSRQLMEQCLSRSARLGDFQLSRFIVKDTFDEYAYRFANVAFSQMDFDQLLFGPFSEASAIESNQNEAEAIITRAETPIDTVALSIWRRFRSQIEGDSDALTQSIPQIGTGLSYLLRPFELWALKRNPSEILPDAPSIIVDPVRILSLSNAIGETAPRTQASFPNPLPHDTKLALSTIRSKYKPPADQNDVLPHGVVIAAGSLISTSSQPALFYRRSKLMPMEAQLRNFALRHKLVYDPIVKCPPAPLSASEMFATPLQSEDDPNDPYRWGLFASAESQAQMFRTRTGLPRKKKKKLRRRGPRLATIIVDDVSGTMRIRIAKKQLVPTKRKSDEVPTEGPAIKRPRADEPVVSMAPSALPKPIAMSHPVPFSDEEDALIVCSAILFGPNFQIASNFLESDLVVRGRLRTPKMCSDRFSLLVRKAKEIGPRLWEKLQAISNPGTPVPPLPNADPQMAYRSALEWLRYRSQIRNKATAEKSFEVISGAVRIIMQNHIQCKLALRTPLSGIPAEAFKEALMRSHASHAAALTAGHKRLMIPHANIGSTLSPRQIVELRALRDRTHESKKMSAMAPPQQITSPSVRGTKMPPTVTTPLMRAASVPLAMSPVMMAPPESIPPAIAVSNSSHDLDQVNGEIDQGNMFLLRQLVQKQPHMKARLVQILQRPDLNQAQKMELAAALFQSNDSSNVDTSNNNNNNLDESAIAT